MFTFVTSHRIVYFIPRVVCTIYNITLHHTFVLVMASYNFVVLVSYSMRMLWFTRTLTTDVSNS